VTQPFACRNTPQLDGLVFRAATHHDGGNQTAPAQGAHSENALSHLEARLPAPGPHVPLFHDVVVAVDDKCLAVVCELHRRDGSE
jgi:hypothetical protein